MHFGMDSDLSMSNYDEPLTVNLVSPPPRISNYSFIIVY